MRGAVVFPFLFSVVAAGVSDSFFDIDNFTHLDCIPNQYKKLYAYYGNRRTAIGERSEPFCTKWTYARVSTLRYISKTKQPITQFGFLPDEYLFHDECRNVQLDLVGGPGSWSQSVRHFFVRHPGWQQGPWCYVWSRKTSMYEPHPCFETCPGNWTPPITSTTAAPTVASSMSSPTRYNHHLLEHLHFAKYIWGDLRYYDSKPSDDPLSDSFRRNRQLVFYALCGVVSILLVFFMATDALSRIREQKRTKECDLAAPSSTGAESVRKIRSVKEECDS
uniref:Kringle domain-containing protein n=1 Tax=Plectus sambesii TaxID=2011161 RepID=A0A914XAU1_9BILA